jgi:DNA anti-recombination protein RmuC
MMQTSWIQSAVADAPDLPIQAQTMGNETGSDFAFAVYTQLAQIHRELGALSTSQVKLDASVKESEVRFTDLARESELRLTRLGEESEKRLTKAREESEKRLTTAGEESEKRLTKLSEDAEKRWAKWSEEAEKRWTKSSEESEKRWAKSSEESEKRLTQLSRESAERFTRRVERVEVNVEKLETSALERAKTTEDKLSSLKDFVHRLFWTGTGIVAVLGVTMGWKPIWVWVSTYSA